MDAYYSDLIAKIRRDNAAERVSGNIPAGWPVYRIIRFHKDDRPSRTIKSGLTLAEAQAHCRDPKTRKGGVYFDGYDFIKGFNPNKEG